MHGMMTIDANAGQHGGRVERAEGTGHDMA